MNNQTEISEIKSRGAATVSGAVAAAAGAFIFCGCGAPLTKPAGRGRPPKRCTACAKALQAAQAAARWRRIRLSGSPRACAGCGGTFTAYNPATVTCSTICGHRHATRTRRENADCRNARTCEQCGESFTARSPSGKARRAETQEGRFCSRSCAATWRRARPRREEVTA